MKTALILIDIQNDYFDGGKNPLVNPFDASQNAAALLSHFRETNQYRIFIQHISRDPNASFFVAGSLGAEIHASVAPQKNEPIIQKQFPNSFKETGLLENLQHNNITHLVICGMMTHMCVDATVRAAKDFGYECMVISDACATKNLKNQDTTIKSVDVQGAFIAGFASYYAEVITTGQFFKNIQV